MGPRTAISNVSIGVLFVSLSAVGCKQALQVSKTAYVIGNNDIVKLEDSAVSADTAHTADSSVLISTLVAQKKRKFCSGTLIKSDRDHKLLRVITNHHCFANVDENGNVSKDLLAEACVNTQVFLGFRAEETASSTEIGCLTGSLRSDPLGDLAVFTLAGQVPAKFKPLSVWSDGEVPAGRLAMIVHYPDVDENFMQVAGSRSKLPVASLTDVDCETQGSFPQSEWRFDPALPYSMKHSCDLLHGSSGSALIDRETKEILGVNWGGIKIDYKKNIDTINVATRADYLLAFLSGRNADWQAVAATQQSSDANPTKQRSSSSAKSGAGVVACGVVQHSGSNPSSIMVFMPLILLAFRRNRKTRTQTALA